MRLQWSRYCLWIILVCFFNTFINAPDSAIRHTSGKEDLRVNDTESIVEWVLEDVLAIEDAVPEQDEQDTEKKGQQSLSDWDGQFPSFQLVNFTPAKTLQISLTTDPLLSQARSVISPPPEG